MMAGAYDREDGPATDRLGLVFPVGWSLQAAAFSWLEDSAQRRSAADIYARLSKARPDVLLNSRVPTHTLPCREYAAGDWLGHGLEVAVTGEDFSVQITLVEKLGSSWPIVLASTSAIDEIRALTDQCTSMKQLSLSVAMLGLAPDIANAKFARALGLAAPEAGVVNQRYRKNRRNLKGSTQDGFVDVAFELSTAGDDGEKHSLKLIAQSRTLSPSNSSDQEDWSMLLGASLDTITAIIV